MTKGYVCLGECVNRHPALVPHLGGLPLIVHRVAAKMGRNWANVRLLNMPGEDRAQAHLAGIVAGAKPMPSALPVSLPASVPERAFAAKYASGEWAPAGGSGTGSKEPEARPYITAMNVLIGWNRWQRVVDLGSGDGWVCSQLQAAEVVGVECVAAKVEECRQRYPRVQWQYAELDRDRDKLPVGDVALLKDVLHHAPEAFIRDWLTWARMCGKWRYVVLTQDNWQHHPDCAWGGYRGLDPAKAPLAELPVVKVADYLHKTILVMECSGNDG